MKNCVNTLITSVGIEMARERPEDIDSLLALADEPEDLLRRPDRYVKNETFIVVLAQLRRVLDDQEAARKLGAQVADKILAPGFRSAFGLAPESSSLSTSIQRSLARLFLQMSFQVSIIGPRELRLESTPRFDYLHTHDHCLFIAGFIERMIAAAGGRAAVISELSCLVPVDRAGALGTGSHRIDDEGRIWRLEVIEGSVPGVEEEIGVLNADNSHRVEGVVYGADRCVYAVRWEDPRTRVRRWWSSTGGRLGQFAGTVSGLEAGGDDVRAYAQIAEEWKRWVRWEPSYPLTRNKYLGYMGVGVLAVLLALAAPLFNILPAPWDLALSPVVLVLTLGAGVVLVRQNLGYARGLIQRREDMEKFLQSANVGVTTLRPDYTIEYANPLTLDLHGEIVGRKCYEVFRWETEPCRDCPLQEAFVSGNPVRAELNYYNRDGRETWFHVTATPLVDGDGRVTSVVNVATDVSDRKKLECELDSKRRELETSEGRYRGFMANAADAILITGPNNEMIEANMKALELLGLDSLERYSGRDLFETNFVDVDDRLRLRDLFGRMIADRGPRSFETRMLGPAGTMIEIDARAIPIVERGEVVCVQSILRDITLRKQEEFEKRLLLSMSNAIKDAPDREAMVEQTLTGLCAAMQTPVGAVFLRDPDKHQLRLVFQTGMSSAAIQKLVAAAVDGSASDHTNRAAILKRPIVIGDIQGLKLGPEEREFFQRTGIVSFAGVPMLLDDELQGLIYIAARDREFFSPRRISVLNQVANELAIGISKQKLNDLLHLTNRELTRKNQELKNATVQLFQSEKMASVGQLAAGVAHEINNPMGYINSNLNLLKTYREDLVQVISLYQDLAEAVQTTETTDEVRRLLILIEEINKQIDLPQLLADTRDMVLESIEGAERVTAIVKGLKDFSHPEGGEARWTDLQECIESTLKVVWNELKYKAEVIKEYGDLPQIKCYPQELKQVFMNLLVNAAQAIPQRGQIIIRTRREDQTVVVSIQDSGNGIPREQQSKIFDPFFTTKDVGKGTGLGLSISYSIIQKHQGKIEVRSEPGQGTTFEIRLPIEVGATPATDDPCPDQDQVQPTEEHPADAPVPT